MILGAWLTHSSLSIRARLGIFSRGAPAGRPALQCCISRIPYPLLPVCPVLPDRDHPPVDQSVSPPAFRGVQHVHHGHASRTGGRFEPWPVPLRPGDPHVRLLHLRSAPASLKGKVE